MVTTITEIDRNAIEDIVIAADIAYWCQAYYEDNTLLVIERDSDKKFVLTIAQIFDWILAGNHNDLVNSIGDPYQKTAIRDIVARNWEELDYDAETGDLILQWILFGELVYG